MTAVRQRGACPGLANPMATGDGLLARFTVAAPMTPAIFAGLCAAVGRDGNETMEISARGSLQVRGLTPCSAPRFAAAVANLGIAAADGTVVTNPLDGDPDALIDGRAVAAELRDAIAMAGFALAPKVSVAIDTGGRLHLDTLAADIRLRAIGSAQAPRLGILVGGDGGPQAERSLGSVAPGETVPVVLALLRAIAARGGRAADFIRVGGAINPEAFGMIDPAPLLSRRPPTEPIGRHRLRDGTVALGIALAFGHATAATLASLAGEVAALGARAITPAPGRALLLIGIAEENIAALAEVANHLGFIVDPGDPRRRIVACPGAPACASGLIAARAIAAKLASTHLPGGNGAIIHVSGCAKGCAHPGTAALTLVGSERGCGIVRNGTARDAPTRYVDPTRIASELFGLAVMAEAAHG
jgi:precorrin-3B synthase